MNDKHKIKDALPGEYDIPNTKIIYDLDKNNFSF